MIPDSIKLHLSETMLQQIDRYSALAVKNKFTEGADGGGLQDNRIIVIYGIMA